MTCPVTFASYRQQANDGLRFLTYLECFATVLGHDPFRETARDIIKIFQKWKLMRVFLSIVIIISVYSSHTTGHRPPLILCESFVVPTRAHYRLGTSHTQWNWSAGFPYSSSCSINRLRLMRNIMLDTCMRQYEYHWIHKALFSMQWRYID